MVTKFLLLVGIDRFWRSVISDSVFLYLGRTLNSLHLNGKKLKQPHTSISRPSAFKNNQQWCDLTSRPNLRKLQNAPLLNISCLLFSRILYVLLNVSFYHLFPVPAKEDAVLRLQLFHRNCMQSAVYGVHAEICCICQPQ